ncbi:MAG: ankyrin repeat domain-containing protein [Patiriisocius sp.]|uniref:ankyrin repeat domain-containing protein n=1 Tax=Patiriisocius sp. TaxID=2822396 RepID=UPI003EF0D960
MIKNIEDYFLACKDGNLDVVKEYINIYPANIEVKTKEGWTGLVISSFNHHFEIVKFLVENGANVNAVNSKGTTVFMYAKTPILNKSIETIMLSYLLESGALINQLDIFKKSVLDYVLENNDEKLATWLIKNGALTGSHIIKLEN